VSAPAGDNRDIRLSVPARADYVVLARLALSAVCRLTALGHMDVADLKLAATEAASLFLAEDDAGASIEFSIRLQDAQIELELHGRPGDVPDDERELSQAILAATVDTLELDSDRALLVKRLPA
jgi:anti-sigma regulatory factor (Ser/Thr protein kinase)